VSTATETQTLGEPDGPVAQSIRIGFAILRLATLALALAWAFSNVREVPPDQQALVLRFGQVVRVQPAGLVLALPRPIETIVVLPSAARQLTLEINAGAAWEPAILDPDSTGSGVAVPSSVSLYLTGDGGAVLLDAAVTYRIVDAAAYYLAAAHVEPALQRLFRAAAVGVAADRSLDDFLVARPEQIAGGTAAQARREAVKSALADAMNRRLRALAAQDAGLGIEVERIDVTALLPPSAKLAFDAVLDATQTAEQGLAAARTAAERDAQAAVQARDRILAGAHASAEERVRGAQAQVAEVTSLTRRMDPASRPSLLDQVYRERIAVILQQAGTVQTIDVHGGSRLILPGAKP
jgi:regulator of protease activity HflC (stomatin/prohibitin superfamily)